MDVFAERAAREPTQTVVVVPDLGYGGCRLVVAVPESWIDVTHIIDLVDLTTEFKDAGKTFRVSTKYPALTQAYFRKWGIYYYQMIDSDGALELHPSLGIADIIVDLTSSGTTLKDNRLREIEEGTVLDSAACLIGHAPSLAALVGEGETGPLALFLDAMDGVRGASGWLHLEVVGNPTPPPAPIRPRWSPPSAAGGCLTHRARRSLGRRRQPRLDGDRPALRQEAHRLPAPRFSDRGQPRCGPAAANRVRPRCAFNLWRFERAVAKMCRLCVHRGLARHVVSRVNPVRGWASGRGAAFSVTSVRSCELTTSPRRCRRR